MGASQDSVPSAFQLWKEHSSGLRIDPGLMAQEILRQIHPGYYVHRVSEASCPLDNFAQAGFAKAVTDPRGGWAGNRDFVARRRMDGAEGVIKDFDEFKRMEYHWNDKEFIVYHVSYTVAMAGCYNYYYILAPEQTGATEHHPDTDALVFACGTFATQLHEEIEVFDDARWKKSKDLYRSIKGSSWDSVILDPAMKADMMRDVQDFFNNRDIYKTLKVPWKRGVILHGVPGNGKTISIKALINSLASRPDPVPSLYVKSLDARQGAKWSIQRIFEHARNKAPCLLIFEDLDSMVEDKFRSYFLNEVDGLESNEGILMIGSTNHLNRLDPAIAKRPSRFDRKYLFALPGLMERTLYCQSWRKKFDGSDAVDFPEELCSYAAKLTDGFSFAYLQELFIASLLALARGPVPESADQEDDEQQKEDEKEKEKKEEEKEENKEEKKKNAAPVVQRVIRKLPEVEIPDGMHDKALFGIIKTQAQALLREMDNTAPEDRAKVSLGTTSGPLLSARHAMPMPIHTVQARPVYD